MVYNNKNDFVCNKPALWCINVGALEVRLLLYTVGGFISSDCYACFFVCSFVCSTALYHQRSILVIERKGNIYQLYIRNMLPYTERYCLQTKLPRDNIGVDLSDILHRHCPL